MPRGVAALLWSTNYGTSPAAVRDRLFSTTRTLPESGTAMTFGRLDAAAATAGAVTRLAASPPPKPVSVSGLPLAISWPPVVRPFPIDAAAHTAMAVPTAAVAQADQGLNGGWAIDD